MKIGIDGNMWYCSNGLCLGDSRAKFSFERTLREAHEAYQALFDDGDFQAGESIPELMVKYLDNTPEEYKAKNPI